MRYEHREINLCRIWWQQQRNLFEILLNQTEIRLYLPFSEWFGTKQMSVWCQINRKMINTIWFRFDLIRFRKDYFMCCRILRRLDRMFSCFTDDWQKILLGKMIFLCPVFVCVWKPSTFHRFVLLNYVFLSIISSTKNISELTLPESMYIKNENSILNKDFGSRTPIRCSILC